MKYHNENQINRIRELDHQIAIKFNEIKNLARESETLTEELYNEHGERFCAFGTPYQIWFLSRGFGLEGNRYHLKFDNDTKVIT